MDTPCGALSELGAIPSVRVALTFNSASSFPRDNAVAPSRLQALLCFVYVRFYRAGVGWLRALFLLT